MKQLIQVTLSLIQVKVDDSGFKHKPVECQSLTPFHYSVPWTTLVQRGGPDAHDVHEYFEKDEKSCWMGSWCLLPGPQENLGNE